MKVLYISSTSRNERPYYDPSVRYRCFNYAEYLNKNSNFASVISYRNFEKYYESLLKFDIYIFHRPYFTDKFPYIYDTIKTKKLIADVDDNNFNINAVHDLPLIRKNGGSKVKDALKTITNYYEGLRYFDNIIASTDQLRSVVQKKIKPKTSFVGYNSVTSSFKSYCDLARKHTPKVDRFGYFSGTNSHDIDYKIFNEAIQQMDLKHMNSLILLGPCNVDNSNKFLEIKKKGIVEFNRLPFEMAKCYISIAPLEKNSFTECKSAIKYMEAFLCGCRVIATDIPDFKRFNTPFLLNCKDISDWKNAIHQFIECNDTIDDSLIDEYYRQFSLDENFTDYYNYISQI